jgi:exonuclease VII large subunit
MSPVPTPAAATSAASYSREQVEGLKQDVAEAEQKLDQSLRSLYERDVRIARLEAQLEAAAKVETAAHQYSERLEERLARVEAAAEDKEKEIRRLALTLGETRGEVKLLRGPVETKATKRRWRHWRLAAVAGIALTSGLAVYHLASTQLAREAGVTAALAILLTPLLRSFIEPAESR